jgi:predicted acetyltransferase
MRHGNGAMVRALLEVDGQARGYAIYRSRSEWDQRGPKGVVTILEIAALDPVAEAGLWQWACGIDLIGTVRVWRGRVPHPLQLLVTEPRRLGTTMVDGIWLRIVDLPAALAARSYRGPAELVLDVTDEFCPWNAGTWRLSVPTDGAAGSATIERIPGAAAVDLSLDVSDVAAVYLGAYRFADLVAAGRVRECRPGATLIADALFATVRAPSTSTMF